MLPNVQITEGEKQCEVDTNIQGNCDAGYQKGALCMWNQFGLFIWCLTAFCQF